MRVQRFTVLSDDELKQIDAASIQMLEQVGVKIHCDEARGILLKVRTAALLTLADKEPRGSMFLNR